MPDSTIETLDIQVKSSTARAVTALDNLANKLYDVSKAFKSVDTGSMRNYSREIGRVSSSLKSMSGIKINVPKLSGLSKQLQSLTNVNFTALNASSKPLKELASGLNVLKGVSGVTIPKLDYKNINSVSKAIEKIGKLDTGNIQNSVNGISKVSHAMSVLNNVDFSDSKISSVINSIRKLMAVDTKGFDTQIFDSIYKSVSKLGNLPDVSSSINRLVASLARLISSGNNTGIVASKLPAVGNAIKQTANKLASVKGVEESINQFISALASLSSAGKKVELSANGLQIMAKELLSFFNTMSKAPAVSKNTVEMTKALAQLAASGGRVSSAVNTMNTSFGKLRNGFSELASLASRAGSTVSSGIGKMVNAIRNIGSASGSISTVNFSLKNLIQTAIGFKAVQAFGQFTKDAITLGSDITEAENVIDVSFGKLKYKAYDFASTASKQFGVSELAAKRYTGTIMAMLKSSGVAQNAASDMSVALAGLAGDIASFYNIDTDTAFYKIRAGISGEIEPLKQLGINMSVANMSAYALANGITKSWTSMTQAEQATLRYNYLMSVTKDAQGDFARTAGTWANQVRLLKLNIQSLSAVMGQGIIAAVLPAIKALNALMSRLMQAANMFRNFMYVLMGKKIKGATKGVVNDLGGVGDSAIDLSGLGSAGNDASKGMNKASKAAKELKKTLSVLPFDELNQLNDNKQSSDTGSGGGAGGSGSGGGVGGGIGGLGDLSGLEDEDYETPISHWASRIRKAFLDNNWYGVGREIANMLNAGLQLAYDALDWKNVGPKITSFTTKFTQAINGFLDNFDFKLLGKVVGAGITDVVRAFNQIASPDGGINFKTLGTGIAESLKGMIQEIPWTELGNALGNYFMISWRILNGFLNQLAATDNTGLTGFQQIGVALGKAVNGMFQSIDFATIADTFAVGINGVFSILGKINETVHWSDIAANISHGINTFITGVNWEENGQILSTFVKNLLGVFSQVAQNTDWAGLGRGIGTFLSSIDWSGIFGEVFTTIKTILGGLISGLGTTIEGKFIIAFGAIKLATAVDKIVSPILSAFGLIPKEVDGSSSLLIIALKKMAGAFSKSTLGTAIGTYVLDAIGLLKGIPGKITTDVAPKIAEVISTKLFPKAVSFAGGIASWVTGTFAPAVSAAFSSVLGVLFSPIGLAIVGVIVGGFLIYKNWGAISKFIGNVKENIVNGFNSAGEWLKEKGKNLIEGLRNGWESAKSGFGTAVSTIGEFIKEKVGNAGEWLKEKGQNAVEGIRSGWESVKESKVGQAAAGIGNYIKGKVTGAENWLVEKGKQAVNGMKNGWENVKNGNFQSTVKGLKSFTVNTLANTSPAAWLVAKGAEAMKGMLSGLKGDKWTDARNWLKKLPSNVKNAVGDMYKVGQNIIKQFINGFKSLRIPTTHISWGTKDFNFGGMSLSIPTKFKVDWYKKGGLFDSASVIGVGEAGSEAVLPLENPKTMKMIADSIVGNSGGMVDESIIADAVERGVVVAMMNNSGNQPDINLYATLYTEDNEVLARSVAKGQARNNYRLKPSNAY